MDRSQDYRDGVAFATKRAITWLHNYAKTMNEDKAVAILNVAADRMGTAFRTIRETNNG